MARYNIFKIKESKNIEEVPAGPIGDKMVYINKNDNAPAIIVESNGTNGVYVGSTLEVFISKNDIDKYVIITDKIIVDNYITMHEQFLRLRKGEK